MLDYNNADRSYLYGRLYAATEEYENKTGTKLLEGQSSQIANNPETLQKIIIKLMGQHTKHDTVYKNWQNQISSVFAAMSYEDYCSNEPLNGLFWLGYHHQDAAIRERRNKVGVIISASGYTQKQVAEALDVQEVTVSRWCTGRTMPPPAQLERLAEYLNVSVDELI